MKIERVILNSLINNIEYTTKVIPYIDESYFHDDTEKKLYLVIRKYINEYGCSPDKTSLRIEASNYEFKDNNLLQSVLNDVTCEIDVQTDWLLNNTRSWCEERAVFNAVNTAIEVYDGNNKEVSPDILPELFKNAVSITFDTKNGHDYFNEAESRYEYYTSPLSKIPFDISLLNIITNGGVLNKTLNVLIAGVNVGKTLFLVHLAASYIKSGYNVVYITLEMSEEEIGKRIDANLLDIDINKIFETPKETFLTKIDKLKSLSYGKFKIKEYPPGVGNSLHFTRYLDDISVKENFNTDILIIDYIGITASSRVKIGSTNSYFYIKNIAEELRAIAVEKDIVVWTASQFNRPGMKNSDADMTDTAESVALPATADFMLSITRSDDLDLVNQIMLKQLKNRYGDKTKNNKFTVGISLEKQKLLNLNLKDQEQLLDDEDYINTKRNQNSLKNKFAGLNN